jgi:Methane/Phenol/Toluene Hydroxylase
MTTDSDYRVDWFEVPAAKPWESAAEWQPRRELLENLLIAYHWGEAFTALNVAVKPTLDARRSI